MTTAIIFLVISVIVDIFIIKWERKEAKMPSIWKGQVVPSHTLVTFGVSSL